MGGPVYRLILFDSDGTLSDTLPWARQVFNELADAHGFLRVEPGQEERLRELHGRELLRALGLPLWKVPSVVRSMRARMDRDIHLFRPFPGVPGMLRRLAGAGKILGVVSSNSRANVERILGPENSAFIRHFGCGASMFGKAARLRQVVRASGVPAAQGIYIGDEVRDAEAAHEAGLAFGAVAWGHHRLDTLRAQRPAFCFSTVEEMATQLGGARPW